MIKGSELLTNCVKEIQALASGLEAKYGTIVITSGYRSPEYNAKVGGSPNSQHIKGKAIDVYVPNVSPIKVCAWVLDNFKNIHGFGLAIYQGYCHFDCRDGANVYWIYGKDGKVA